MPDMVKYKSVHERVDCQGKQENLITKINYSGRIKGVVGMAIFGVPALVLRSLERGPSRQSLPVFMRGRLFDVMAAPCSASFNKLLFGDDFFMNFAAAIITPALFEISQGVEDGTFDPDDIVAYTVGALGWAAFEGTAKAIHDSGVTLPIYKMLGIQHRKFS
jgi:hypothetical protein